MKLIGIFLVAVSLTSIFGQKVCTERPPPSEIYSVSIDPIAHDSHSICEIFPNIKMACTLHIVQPICMAHNLWLCNFTNIPECGPNATYNLCGSACPATCARPIPPSICTLQCVPDCFCNRGFLKNNRGLCVPARQCKTWTLLYEDGNRNFCFRTSIWTPFNEHNRRSSTICWDC